MQRFGKPILFVMIVLAVVGAYLSLSVPIAVFPSTNFPRIVIGADAGVTPIDQMLVTVTRPLENAVNSVRGLRGVYSITSRGSAEIDLSFDWNVDMFQTLARVNAALAGIRGELPPNTALSAHRLTFSSFPVLGYSLTSRTVPQTQLWQMAQFDIKPRLNRLAGVSTVVVQGGREPEFHIIPEPAELQRAGVTVADILAAVNRGNVVHSPGLINSGHQLYLTLVSGQVRTPQQISGLVVKLSPQGTPVRVGDVAAVRESVRPVYTIVSANGQPAVLLNINRQPGSNTMLVASEVHREIESLRQSLPPGIHLQPFYDQSDIVGASIKSVRDAILLGMILASIILVVFLRDWGTSVVAGLVIPVTVMVTFIILKMLGQSFNLMTLGGLAAAVGLVIDDAIVVVENIVLHRDAGQSLIFAIRSGLREITIPLLGSTFTPIVVFLPLISITGVTGVFFRALAITVSAALVTSLALALTWTPALSQYLIKDKGPGGLHDIPPGEEQRRLLQAEEASVGPLFRRILRGYERALQTAFDRPGWLLIGSAVLIVVSYGSYRLLGSDLLPQMDEGGFVVDYVMPAGSSLQETNRVISHIEHIITANPDVQGISRRTGLQLGLAAVTEANTGDISVKLKPNRQHSTAEVEAVLRHEIAEKEPVPDIEFANMLQDMIGDLTNAPEPVEVKLFSENAALLRQWAPRVGDAIGKVPGIVDVMNGIDDTISGPALSFHVNAAAAARAGFTPEEVAQDAQALLQGVKAEQPVIKNARAYNIRVRFPGADRATVDAMRNTVLTSASGHTATLGALAELRVVPGQTEILEENLQRDVIVSARLENTDLGHAIAGVKSAVAGLHLPAGIRVVYGGGYQQQQKSFKDLLLVLLLAIVLVFAVLLFEFGSFSAPAAILASALLSTSGVLLALLLTGTTFNIASFMGLIMVVGIVAKNGILLLDAEQKFRDWGYSGREAMLQAGRRRLRPIVMTALATVAGMLPLAFGIGAGSQMLQPLAIAVIGGVVISMALSLVITPVAYVYMSGRARQTQHVPVVTH